MRKSESKKEMQSLSLRSMSRDMLKRNKSLLKIINDQKSWSKKEVKQIREFNGILTAKALYQASADYSDHLS